MKNSRHYVIVGMGVLTLLVLVIFVPIVSLNQSQSQIPIHEWTVSSGEFLSINATNLDQPVTGEPFLKDSRVVISWKNLKPFDGYMVEVACDAEFSRPIATLNGHQPPCLVHQDVIGEGGRFFYRVTVFDETGLNHAYSPVRWFAVDRRFTGGRIIPMGDHPNGKTESSPMVKDQWGRVHLVMQHDISDTGQREILWWTSVDDGEHWHRQGVISRPQDTFTGTAAIAASPDGQFLAVGYLSGIDPTCPKQVTVCSCDLTVSEPTFENHYDMPGDIGYAVRRPFVCVDEARNIHAVWDGYESGSAQVIHSENAVFYAGCIDGHWKPILQLSNHQTTGFPGGSTIVAGQGYLYAIWCDGNSRISWDAGLTWDPPLNQAPELLQQDYADRNGFRWWQLTTTVIPGTRKIAMIRSARHGLDGDLDTWTGWMNIRELYLTVFDPISGWSEPRSVHSVKASLSETVEPVSGQKFLRMERPDLSADGNGTIYLAWDETMGVGPNRDNWQRKGYLLTVHPDGRTDQPQLLPAPAGLHVAKPMFTEASTHPGMQLCWFTGEMIPKQVRPFGQRDNLGLLGVTVANVTDLGPLHGQVDNLGAYSIAPFQEDIGQIENFPRLPVFGMRPSAKCLTYTPPPTFTATPSPKPTVISNVSSVADSTVQMDASVENLGYDETLQIARTTLHSRIYVKFPVPRKKAGQQFISATLKMYLATALLPKTTYMIYQCRDDWWEDTITESSQPELEQWRMPFIKTTQSPGYIEISVNNPIKNAWNSNIRYVSFMIEALDGNSLYLSKESTEALSDMPIYLQTKVIGTFGSSQSPPVTPTPGHNYWITCPVDQDAMVSHFSVPDQNFGSDPLLTLNGRDRSGLIQFLLPRVRPEYLVSADLILQTQRYPEVESALNLYRVTEPWVDDQVTGNDFPESVPVVHDHYLEHRAGTELLTLTDTVWQWLDATKQNYGIRLNNWDSHDNDTIMRINSSESSDPPELKLRLTHVDHEVDVDLRLNDTTFSEAMSFTLDVYTSNFKRTVAAGQFYVMLEVYGTCFFWPGWNETVDSVDRMIPANSMVTERILEFTWPSNAGKAQGVRFWTCFIDDDTGDVSYDFAVFGWE